MSKTSGIPVQVHARTRLDTRDRPHQWTVIVEVPSASRRNGFEVEIGQVYEHSTGDPEDPDRTGYEARLTHGPADFEVRGQRDHGTARTPGLGIATKGEAVVALVREFTYMSLADRFHEHGED